MTLYKHLVYVDFVSFITVLKLLFERYLGVFPYLGPSQKQSMDRLHSPKRNKLFPEEENI